MSDLPREKRPIANGPVLNSIYLGIVHHANQYIITDGYENREGINELVGTAGSNNNYLKIIELHKTYHIPLNLHVSGTLIETLLWHRPDFLEALKDIKQQGLLELIGSSYGQNIMRFFDCEHNLRQLNKELRLYRDHLQINPQGVQVFWPPERVWDTERLAPALTNRNLLNGGYKYVLVDDRLFYPRGEGLVSRKVFDKERKRHYSNFTPCRILDGYELVALPIVKELRYVIPPRDERNMWEIQELLQWLAAEGRKTEEEAIAIYGDDFEKAAGIGGWDSRGPSQYEAFLKWLSQTPWVRAVKLSDWAAMLPVRTVASIDVGGSIEISNHFGAGEDYEKWYFSSRWDKYRRWYLWSEKKVKSINAEGADPNLIDLAWSHLLATSWETAWHTPSSGVHGNPLHYGEPSPWIKALGSQSRLAAVVAEAASWMHCKDNQAHAYLVDIDNDGEEEIILKNSKLFAVLSQRWGGRLVYLFSIAGEQGKLVIGNPCDCWNWLEDLHQYMEVPANHPGALTDIGYEHDQYKTLIESANGVEGRVKLINQQRQSLAFGMEKLFSLTSESNEIRIAYQLPEDMEYIEIECGLSPDYHHLLQYGKHLLREHKNTNMRGYSNNGVEVWLRHEETMLEFDDSDIREFGHGYTVKIRVSSPLFTIWIGACNQSVEAVTL